MLTCRIIPTLLLDKNRLVRTKCFQVTEIVGSPVSQAKILNANEADEIIFLDIRGNSDLVKVLNDVSEELFIPLTVGGYVDTIQRIGELMLAGADKVVLRTKAFEEPTFISRAADKWGCQAISVCVDILNGKILTRRIVENLDPIDWAVSAVKHGAGEIILHFADRDGMMGGFDIGLLKKVSDAVTAPVVVMGGAGSLGDFEMALSNGASGVAASSFFSFTDQSPIKVKSWLVGRGVNVRSI